MIGALFRQWNMSFVFMFFWWVESGRVVGYSRRVVSVSFLLEKSTKLRKSKEMDIFFKIQNGGILVSWERIHAKVMGAVNVFDR